jgi:hypothetical protein
LHRAALRRRAPAEPRPVRLSRLCTESSRRGCNEGRWRWRSDGCWWCDSYRRRSGGGRRARRRRGFGTWRFSIHQRPRHLLKRCRLHDLVRLDNGPHGFEPVLRPVLLRLKLDEREAMRGQSGCVGGLLSQPVRDTYRLPLPRHVRHSGADNHLWLRWWKMRGRVYASSWWCWWQLYLTRKKGV